MIKTGYSEPKLAECGADITKEWYVGFRYTCPLCLVRKPYQVRMGMNYLKSVLERRAEGKVIAGILKKSLAAGWNPHHEAIEVYLKRSQLAAQHDGDDAMEVADMPFNKALDYALEAKSANMVPKSVACYTTGIDFVKKAAVALNLHEMPIKDAKRRHIKAILNRMVTDRQKEYDAEGKGKKVTGNFFNKYKGYLQGVFTELWDFEAVEYNPCDRLKNKPEIKTNIHRHATTKERNLIKSQLQLKCPMFFIYLEVEYHTGIRPNEIFGIKICDIDWFNAAINIPPVEGGSKTRDARMVPIPNVLMRRLEQLNLRKYDATYYLFSDAFRPGAIRKHRDYATKLWKELIKDELGLNVSLYSFKGLGGDDRREAGISVGAVSAGFGHSKLGTSMIYLHGERERMNQELRQKARDL